MMAILLIVGSVSPDKAFAEPLVIWARSLSEYNGLIEIGKSFEAHRVF